MLKLKVVLFVVAMSVAVWADGSDPMPLCRPTSTKSCPKVADSLPLFDGGPLLLCPPTHKDCKKQTTP
jgi:hypothetical protein